MCRLFLKKLKETLKIPVLALVDSDPYGLKILSVYMNGAPGTQPALQTICHSLAPVQQQQRTTLAPQQAIWPGIRQQRCLDKPPDSSNPPTRRQGYGLHDGRLN